ncbi:MAG: GDYXXLXY domain-containing protein [Clostridia bacterium]|nr:GDYXXLXY domain-containing protein [Clostridia bacterium]
MRSKLWFTLAVGLQIAVLLIMIGMKLFTLTYGTKVLLQTLPVDPWDMFRGDYVTLNYVITQVDLKKVTADKKEYKHNERVYVGLKKDGKYWVAKSVSGQPPDDGSLAIKGKVNYYDEMSKIISINYGIDSYYVPQHEGRKIENARVLADVEVSVDRWGNSALSKLFLEGKEVQFQ